MSTISVVNSQQAPQSSGVATPGVGSKDWGAQMDPGALFFLISEVALDAVQSDGNTALKQRQMSQANERRLAIDVYNNSLKGAQDRFTEAMVAGGCSLGSGLLQMGGGAAGWRMSKNAATAQTTSNTLKGQLENPLEVAGMTPDALTSTTQQMQAAEVRATRLTTRARTLATYVDASGGLAQNGGKVAGSFWGLEAGQADADAGKQATMKDLAQAGAGFAQSDYDKANQRFVQALQIAQAVAQAQSDQQRAIMNR